MGSPTFRVARQAEASVLRDVERAASLTALAHVFPPSRYPYPSTDVLARWGAVLADPEMSVLVHEQHGEVVCLVAHDTDTVHHLAVRPDHWGMGLATAALRLVTRPRRQWRLWCLAANRRALSLYAHLGWQRSGRARRAEWPPSPLEVELVLTPPPTLPCARRHAHG